MSWLEARRLALACLIGGAALALAGCGIRPLYGTSASGAKVPALLASIDVNKVPGRVGQRLRNELNFQKTGGGGDYASKAYRLDIAIREQITDQLVRVTGDVTGQVYQLNANFKLVRLADSKVVLEGNSVGRAPFDRVESIYANVRARLDAENRAADTVAEGIKTRLAAFLSGTA